MDGMNDDQLPTPDSDDEGDPPLPAGYRLLVDGELCHPGDIYLSNGKWYRQGETMRSVAWNPRDYYPFATTRPSTALTPPPAPAAPPPA
jgi:L-ascorbate metabolism protein UlaG (beta-lactamase superfamily)